jgi:putative ABC transport system permease protein
MTLLHRLASVMRWVLRRDSAERELDEELRAFVDLAAADKVRDGASPAEARRLAVLQLGGVEQAKERVRTGRHGGWLDGVGRDVRYACRMFVRHRGFTAVVVLTLALGIGANTAIFSLIDALMLRWLPVPNPQELVQISFEGPDQAPGGESFSNAIIRGLADQKDIFAGVAGFGGWRMNVGASRAITGVSGALVTGDFYETLGLTPVEGRLLSRADDEPGAPEVAVISYGYWEREFARSPQAVGDTLIINGVPTTIVGVSPRGFVGANVGAVADITLPANALASLEPQMAALLGPGNFWLRVLARPRPGISIAQAEARLAIAWPAIAERAVAPHWPASQRQSTINSTLQLSRGGTGWTYLREIYVQPLFVLMGVVALVLLIACANVASLLLARASARRREIAVRLAIGAGRGRIVRQLLIEGLLMALAGASLGVALAWLSGNSLVALIERGPNEIAFDLTPNWRVLGFTAAVAVATALIFGVAPALQSTSAAPSAALQDVGPSSRHRSRLLPSLVSAQVALSLVLLVGAGLFGRTLQNLRHFDPGFQPEGVFLVDLDTRQGAGARELADELRRIAGVVSASVSTHTPLSGSTWSEPAVPAGQPVPERDNAYFIGASPDFFATMKIRLLAGREFSERDSADAPAVAIVNERFAAQHFPNQNPVGQHLSTSAGGKLGSVEIVGVVGNTNVAGLRAAPPPTVYVSYQQLPRAREMSLEFRAAGTLERVIADVRQGLHAKMPDASLEVRPLSSQVQATMVQERMMATLAGGFGILALLLASVGLYGLLAYRVTQRTKEIGIRMAVGAQRAQVITLILKGATRLVVLGILIGLPAAWMASRWIESMLFGLKSGDPVAMGGAILLLLAVTQLAAYLPAWRASRVDPLPALRHE